MLTAVTIEHLELMCTCILHEVTFVSVKPAGWDSIVSKKRMSACLIHVRTVAAVWTAIMASLVCVKLDTEVNITITINSVTD